ncbi:MAG: protein translocase subunit SecF [bacterium]
MQIIGKTNIDFIGMRRYAFIFSAALVIIGIVSLGIIVLGQADLSIDFAGGTLIRGSFSEAVAVGDLRSALADAGYGDAKIHAVSGTAHDGTPIRNTFDIRVKGSAEAADSVAGLLGTAIAQAFPDKGFKLDKDRLVYVGPSVGQELQSQARTAVIVALVCILVYIWIRFDFRFGVAATIATFHDVLAVLGLMFLFQREISLLVVSALLTLAGYSLTDTVVVFDRIRENLKFFRKKGDFVSAVNQSINEVLSRTLMTSITTFLAVASILVLGGEVVRDFALALTLGVVIGTYSSVFVASPIVVVWENRAPKRFK